MTHIAAQRTTAGGHTRNCYVAATTLDGNHNGNQAQATRKSGRQILSSSPNGHGGVLIGGYSCTLQTTLVTSPHSAREKVGFV